MSCTKKTLKRCGCSKGAESAAKSRFPLCADLLQAPRRLGGNASALTQFEDWAALLADAMERGASSLLRLSQLSRGGGFASMGRPDGVVQGRGSNERELWKPPPFDRSCRGERVGPRPPSLVEL